MSTIQVENLSKAYGGAAALQDLSFAVAPGELFGLIGPDGAGKTTLFKILVTLLSPDRGRAWVLGRDVVKDYRQLRQRIGYMPGRFSLYPDLTIEENLRFFAAIFGTTLAANYEQIRDIYQQIEPFRHRRAGALSGGMKQKLALCCALIHRPEVLFLDEPTTGVDAVSRQEFWDMLGRLQASGLTIMVATPYMDEALRCTRVALMQGGQLLGVDTPANITAAYPRPLWAISGSSLYAMLQALRRAPFCASCFAFGQSLHLSTQVAVDATTIANYLHSQQLLATAITPIAASIEDSFMALLQTELSTPVNPQP